MADIDLTITLKSDFISRILDSLNGSADKNISLSIDSGVHFEWSYVNKAEGESNKQFGERFLKEMIRAFVRTFELSLDQTRFSDEINALIPISQSVPNEIVE